MMDCDQSESLEASLFIIYYHFLMAHEIDPQLRLPSRLLSAHQIEAVEACRSLDKKLLGNNPHVAADVATILNCNVNLVRPLVLIKMLKGNLETQMQVLQRFDVVESIICCKENLNDYFDTSLSIFLTINGTSEMWLSYMQLYEAKLMEVCEELYRQKVGEYVNIMI